MRTSVNPHHRGLKLSLSWTRIISALFIVFSLTSPSASMAAAQAPKTASSSTAASSSSPLSSSSKSTTLASAAAGGVIVLNAKNFDSSLRDGKVWLIEFYAPWWVIYCRVLHVTVSSLQLWRFEWIGTGNLICSLNFEKRSEDYVDAGANFQKEFLEGDGWEPNTTWIRSG